MSEKEIIPAFSIKEHSENLRREFRARKDLYEKVRRTNFDWVIDLNYEIGKQHIRKMLFRAERSYWKELESGGENSKSIQRTIDQLEFVLDQYVSKHQEVIRLREKVSFLDEKISFHKIKDNNE